MAKKVNFSELSVDELKVKIRDLSKDLVLSRMKVNQRVLKDTSTISRIRKDIARAKTFLRLKKKGRNA